MRCLRVALPARVVTGVLLALGLLAIAPPADAGAANSPETAAGRLLIASAGWHGRAIRDPHEHTAVRTAAPSFPPGWSAGPVPLGTGLASSARSDRVREIQRRLRKLGYATGPVDGIYGRRTRAAVAWFQRKHGLTVDGRTTPATVGHLRERTGASRPRASAGEPGEPAGATPPATTAPPLADTGGTGKSVPMWTVAGLALYVVAFVALGYAIGRRRLRSKVRPVAARRKAAPAPARALGYIRLAPGAPSASFHAQAAAIETGCLARGMRLVSLVADSEPAGATQEPPPSLAFALERVRSGDIDRLVVSRIDHLARTQEQLRDLMASLRRHHSGIVVLDLDIDTAGHPEPAVLAAIASRRHGASRSHPVLTDNRMVDAHIASMADEGVDAREIALALNEEPVPSPGGTQWGPSVVEAALRRRASTAGRREHSDA
jgi:peptidoglycan hydrolase-like protein with peptidoglycan-binding domain